MAQPINVNEQGERGLIITLTRDRCDSSQMCLGCFRPLLADAWALSLSGVQGRLWVCDACAGRGPESIRGCLVVMREIYATCVRVLTGIEDVPIEITWSVSSQDLDSGEEAMYPATTRPEH